MSPRAGQGRACLSGIARLVRENYNIPMQTFFLHGWHSVPSGVKPTSLKDHGHEVISPALPNEDFTGAVRIRE
jgi:hypothetical protein